MTLGGDKKPGLSTEETRILREHWEWGGRYAIFWIVFTILIFGGAHLLFDYLGTDERARVLAFIFLSTLILVNAIWRAAGAVAARLDLRRRERDRE
jgi:hypothetical protein